MKFKVTIAIGIPDKTWHEAEAIIDTKDEEFELPEDSSIELLDTWNSPSDVADAASRNLPPEKMKQLKKNPASFYCLLHYEPLTSTV